MSTRTSTNEEPGSPARGHGGDRDTPPNHEAAAGDLTFSYGSATGGEDLSQSGTLSGSHNSTSTTSSGGGRYTGGWRADPHYDSDHSTYSRRTRPTGSSNETPFNMWTPPPLPPVGNPTMPTLTASTQGGPQTTTVGDEAGGPREATASGDDEAGRHSTREALTSLQGDRERDWNQRRGRGGAASRPTGRRVTRRSGRRHATKGGARRMGPGGGTGVAISAQERLARPTVRRQSRPGWLVRRGMDGIPATSANCSERGSWESRAGDGWAGRSV